VPQKPARGKILTQHTGLPPRAGTGIKAGSKGSVGSSGRPSRSGVGGSARPTARTKSGVKK
ncbi:MAG: hypothetical protein ACKOXZ_07705, partial [Polynucleobacter victoriensis]